MLQERGSMRGLTGTQGGQPCAVPRKAWCASPFDPRGPLQGCYQNLGVHAHSLGACARQHVALPRRIVRCLAVNLKHVLTVAHSLACEGCTAAFSHAECNKVIPITITSRYTVCTSDNRTFVAWMLVACSLTNATEQASFRLGLGADVEGPVRPGNVS
jgi:hypothetical protein